MIRYYPITPTSAPRQVRKDTWKPSPMVQRYRAFRDECRIRHVQIPQPYAHVIFILEMPRSWSAKQKVAMNGMPHQQTPDRDNLEKALLDAVFGQDCSIYDGRTTKVWGFKPGIVISRETLPIQPPLPVDEWREQSSGAAYFA